MPKQWPYSAAPARAALRAAFPARSPLLPALTRSLRAASAFPTSLPQQDKRARSGTLRLYYTSEQTTGETNPETHWGNTRNPPGPENTARFQVFPQTPIPASPDNPARRTNDRGNCTAQAAHTAPHLPDEETCKEPGEPGKPPKARFPRFPRTPSRPSPGPRARSARHHLLAYRAEPATTETSSPAADTRHRADPAIAEPAALVQPGLVSPGSSPGNQRNHARCRAARSTRAQQRGTFDTKVPPRTADRI